MLRIGHFSGAARAYGPSDVYNQRRATARGVEGWQGARHRNHSIDLRETAAGERASRWAARFWLERPDLELAEEHVAQGLPEGSWAKQGLADDDGLRRRSALEVSRVEHAKQVAQEVDPIFSAHVPAVQRPQVLCTTAAACVAVTRVCAAADM